MVERPSTNNLLKIDIMCKYSKIQKSLAEGLQSSILYETGKMAEYSKAHPDKLIPSWRTELIIEYQKALDAVNDKGMYPQLHDIANNFRCGFISGFEMFSHLVGTCQQKGGRELVNALFSQGGIQKKFQELTSAIAKTLCVPREEMDEFNAWVES